jgi:hypothetical protein
LSISGRVKYVGVPPPSAVNVALAQLRSRGEIGGDLDRKVILSQLDEMRVDLAVVEDKVALYKGVTDALTAKIEGLEALL